VRPGEVLDMFDRVARAWRAARGRSPQTVPEIAAIFRQLEALPTQWMPKLRGLPLRTGGTQDSDDADIAAPDGGM
jgi:hypothetical protein